TYGELFVTSMTSSVERFAFNPQTGAAVSKGSFSVPGSSNLHGLLFNNEGELFLTDLSANRVFRYRFDSFGNPVANGSITVAGGPIGVAFSSGGELFVSSHFTGGVSRFLFDTNGTAIPNGFIPTSNLAGPAVFP